MDKMKAEASMLGAKVVLISDAQSRGNYYGNKNSPSQSTQTVFFGQAFNSNPMDPNGIKDKLHKSKYVLYQTYTLNRNGFSPKMKMSLKYDENRIPITNRIEDIVQRDGRLYVTSPGLRSKNSQLEIISLRDGILTLLETHKNTVYNYILQTEESDFIKSFPSILAKD